MDHLESRELELRELNLKQLKHHLQALALPAATQMVIAPWKTEPGYEMADGFSNWYHWYIAHTAEPIAARQLHQIDELLQKMSGRPGPWTERALHHYLPWARIRDLAAEALTQFSWPLEPPAEPI